MNALLSSSLPTTYGETLFFGFQVLVIGMATVFSVLVLIWGILAIFKLFFNRSPKPKSKEERATVQTIATPVVSAPADGEIIAVIAAAIAMAESESFVGKFRVVSFRRK